MSRTRRPRPISPSRRRPGPTATLRGRAEEFAAALPEILGFPPTESLVLLCLGGAGRRPRQHSMSLRVDLAVPEHDGAMAATLLSAVSRLDPPPSAALLFVVTEGPDDEVATVTTDPWRIAVPRPDAATRPAVPDLPRRALVHACIAELSDAGIDTVDAVLVRDDRWWSYPDVDRLTGAGPGRPLDREHSRLAGIAALSGHTVDADRDAVVARAWPATPPTPHMSTACLWADSELGDRIEEGCDIEAVLEQCWATVSDALGSHAPGSRAALPDDAAAAVGIALQLVPVRDRALTFVATADEDQTAAAEALWTDLNTRLPSDLAGVPALLLGYTAWLRGSGVLAVAALERSSAVAPSSMAELLLGALAANTPPDVLRELMIGPEDAEVA